MHNKGCLFQESFEKKPKQFTVKPEITFSICGESESKNGKVMNLRYARCCHNGNMQVAETSTPANFSDFLSNG
jgi:hypothetical protein